MKEVKIAELKAGLSAHLATVRKGEVVIVYDRATPIARLTSIKEPQEDDLVIIEATDPPSEARKVKPIKRLKNVDVDRILAEMREDR
jgi:antitoxin (DNA-binding transcriptional repressor) of toxin-antitoxin stability system